MEATKLYFLYYHDLKKEEGIKFGGIFSSKENAREQIPKGLEIFSGLRLRREEREAEIIEKHEFRIGVYGSYRIRQVFCIVELAMNHQYGSNNSVNEYGIIKTIVESQVKASKKEKIKELESTK